MRKKLSPFTEVFTIEDAASDGRAVTHHQGQVVFVEGAIPGDVAEVHVFRKQKKMLVGKVTSLHKPSSDRIQPKCQHFAYCGGCKWQMMDYSAQLRYKQKQVEDAITRIGKVHPQEILPIIGSKEIFFYRNKLEFTFSSKSWLTPEQIQSEKALDQRALGFHVPRIFDKILNIETCYLQHEAINSIRNEVRTFTRQQGFTYYNIKENQGFLRNLVFRTSRHSGELMVVLIVGEDQPQWIDQIFYHLAGQFPEISHFHWIYNPKKNSSYSDLPFSVWKGADHITEKLGNFHFQIGPTSFFQTNPAQAERLYGVVKSYVQEKLPAGQAKFDCLYDLYSGTGSIGIFVSELAKKVVGIEYVEAAVQDARKNVELNGLHHFSFYAGNMKDILQPTLTEKEGKPQILIADPPRAGMDAKVIRQLLALAPDHIIYVSCQPATQARDIQLMEEMYVLEKIQAVDMFPQTAHVENVALLSRKAV